MSTIVIYDSESSYSDKVAKVVDKVDNVKLVDYRNEEIQNFLEEQFRFKPNCLFVIDDDYIYVGDSATDQLMNRQGVPNIISGILRSRFDDVSTLLSFITDKSSEDIHGKFPIREEAMVFIDNIENDSDDIVEIPINEDE